MPAADILCFCCGSADISAGMPLAAAPQERGRGTEGAQPSSGRKHRRTEAAVAGQLMVMAFPPSSRGTSAARPQPQDTRKGVDCQFWIKGHCGRGASCAFRHDKVSGLPLHRAGACIGGSDKCLRAASMRSMSTVSLCQGHDRRLDVGSSCVESLLAVQSSMQGEALCWQPGRQLACREHEGAASCIRDAWQQALPAACI